jgi:hypothetical protein
MRTRIGALPNVPKAHAAYVGQLLQEEASVEEAEVEKLEPLLEPTVDVARIVDWLRSMRKAAADLGEFAEYLVAGARSRATAAYRITLRANAYSRHLAVWYGFNYCSRLQQ